MNGINKGKNKIKILIIMGTRPEAIKLALVIKKLKKIKRHSTHVCITGQHGTMLDQVLQDFGIKPEFNLKIMKKNQTLSGLSSLLFSSVDQILNLESPDWVLVQGDTTTAMVSALCSYYRKIKVGHIEAGLRTFDFWEPFPEEMNRKMISLVTQKHFVPTLIARQNLLNENIPSQDILLTGNTVIDSLLWMVKKVRNTPPKISKRISDLIDKGRQYVLITGHRRESFGKGFEQICSAIRILAEKHHNIFFVYPVHLNPNVSEPVNRILGDVDRIILTNPLNYKSFVYVMDNSCMVLTDSGGVQEEAPSLNKLVLVMREVTERTEGIDAGTSILVGTSKEKIVKSVSKYLQKLEDGNFEHIHENPYGDGNAAVLISDFFKQIN